MEVEEESSSSKRRGRDKKKKKKKKGCNGEGSSCSEVHVQDTCNRTFGEKCSHIAKKQRAKFYIVRRCIAMLVCWHDKDK